MTPTAPTNPVVAPGQMTMTPVSAARMRPAGSEPSAAPPPDLGSASVTQAEASAKAALGAPGQAKRPMPEIPPDPPPLKGLGVPPLDTSRVGDFDRARETGQPAISDLIAAIQRPDAPVLDRRL